MRTGITSEGEDGAAATAAGPSQVFPFRRGSAAAAPTAGDVTSSSPAPIPLGDAVRAVVMNLANKRIRVKVLRASGLGGGEDEGPR
ncbi:hypothetical protein [Sinorhizobium meliloti]|uniref:hypothetical protein n=1 Tax=Rhizobium meliloti TaxID=382 RepID=UPI000FD70B72|nr:hypothetical protein [Sinorhizobium meliloti]RVG81324.1 hypothetical protein CN219_23755 [Sinorhizobium meliloti]RVI36942.1 hypothetical protein CN197_10310 [Sinorhizobium meliloti]RVI47076.1 hypothetical protein CN196_08230 [Sinorhizobium meliloti]RVJ23888.1 hypothetical protein CN177_17100 [Sinorhizobium meliloti]RVJ94815.1 hypothetical protein CN170_22315 [Sinorhizobium meliloti]